MMPLNEREAILEYLGELHAATAAGKLLWKNVNPTTYAWDSDPAENARIIIQRVERVITPPSRTITNSPVASPKPARTYLFQAFDLAQSPSPKITVDGRLDLEVNEKLKVLFDLIKTGVSPASIVFLKSLLPK